MERLGYHKQGEAFIPPHGHKALFLGDLIDPKPSHPFPGGVRDTLRAVKVMCDRGDALCLMGNHEYNAILYHTKGPNGWLKHHGDRNKRTHQGTLDDFPDHTDPASEWRTLWMPWLKALPIALDLEGFRAVHACWHSELIEIVKDKRLSDDAFLFACTDESQPEYNAIEVVLKGVEVPLPDPHFFIDHTGTKRYQIRARWWEAPSIDTTCRNLVFPISLEIADVPIDDAARNLFSPYPSDAAPVFVGHYFKPANSPLHPERHNVACLDHSAATGGPLVAYRWKGETQIKPEHYIVHE